MTACDIEPLLTTDDVADLLGVAPHTLVVWRHQGRRELPFVKFRRFVRYRPEDVRAYLDRHAQPALAS